MEKHILLIKCDDAKGLIAKISSVVFELQLNILLMKEYVEEETNTFFMRSELFGELDANFLSNKLVQVLPSNAQIKINPKTQKDIVILVTKEFHCLSDLLTKYYFNELNANIKAVIGNYDILKSYTEKFDIPYVCISHEHKTKEQFEDELILEIQKYKPDYIVLAKFMRILSPKFVALFENTIINIHHSFLPAFIGANPYKQAYQRGVKLIGATAHFVNNDLDEGPIISQKVCHVDHSFNIKTMIQAGHDNEAQVLNEALKNVFEDRVFVSNNKTIILK